MTTENIQPVDEAQELFMKIENFEFSYSLGSLPWTPADPIDSEAALLKWLCGWAFENGSYMLRILAYHIVGDRQLWIVVDDAPSYWVSTKTIDGKLHIVVHVPHNAVLNVSLQLIRAVHDLNGDVGDIDEVNGSLQMEFLLAEDCFVNSVELENFVRAYWPNHRGLDHWCYEQAILAYTLCPNCLTPFARNRHTEGTECGHHDNLQNVSLRMALHKAVSQAFNVPTGAAELVSRFSAVADSNPIGALNLILNGLDYLPKDSWDLILAAVDPTPNSPTAS
jgi:hypothetical protein